MLHEFVIASPIGQILEETGEDNRDDLYPFISENQSLSFQQANSFPPIGRGLSARDPEITGYLRQLTHRPVRTRDFPDFWVLAGRVAPGNFTPRPSQIRA
jgi:hypothetical protein